MKRPLLPAVSLCLALLFLLSLASHLTLATEAQAEAAGGDSALSSSGVTMVFVDSGWDATQTALVEQIAGQLTQELGMPVYSLIAACPWAAADMLARGEADVGWLPGPFYPQAHDQYGIDARLVFQRSGSTQYRSQFLVRSDSGINTLADLAGKNFIFPSPDSISGFLMPAYHILKTQGIAYATFFSQTLFAGSHSAAAAAVYTGIHMGTAVHGGAMFDDARITIAGQYPDIYTTTKVVTYTDYVGNDAVAVRPGLDSLLAQQVITGLQNLAGTPAGLAPMQQLFGLEDLLPTDDSAYDSFRDLLASYPLVYYSCTEAGVVTSSGGMVTFVDQNELLTQVLIPSGTTTSTIWLDISSIPAATNLPGGLVDIGRAVNLSGVYSGTNQPVATITGTYTLSFGYYDGALGSVDEGGLAVYWWDGSQWQKEPTSRVDGMQNTVTANPDHFSIFAVLGLKERLYLPAVWKP